jgi:hypothetical protein
MGFMTHTDECYRRRAAAIGLKSGTGRIRGESREDQEAEQRDRMKPERLRLWMLVHSMLMLISSPALQRCSSVICELKDAVIAVSEVETTS